MSTQEIAKKTSYATNPRAAAGQAIDRIIASIDCFDRELCGDISEADRQSITAQRATLTNQLHIAFNNLLQQKM